MPPTESRREIKENTECQSPPKKEKPPHFLLKIRKVFLFCSFILLSQKRIRIARHFFAFFLENRSFFSSEKRTENLIFPFSRGKISYVNLKKTAISRFLLHNRNYVVFLCTFTPPVPDILFFSGVPCLC